MMKGIFISRYALIAMLDDELNSKKCRPMDGDSENIRRFKAGRKAGLLAAIQCAYLIPDER